jgi:hypothetical protein
VNFSWYGTAESAFGDMSAFGLSADWVGLLRNDGKEVQLGLVCFNYKRSGIIGAYRVFVALGLGIRVTTDQVPEMLIGKGSQFAWNGGIGLDFTNSLFGQARFMGGQHPGDDGMSLVELGYRF